MTTSEANAKLMADLKVVIQDAEELLKATAGQAGEKLDEIRGRLSRAVDQARATFERVQSSSRETCKAADQLIREHPYESMGVALGAGLLVGVLLARR